MSANVDARPGSVNPATGAPLEPVIWTPMDAIGDLVAAARGAQPGWAARGLAERSQLVQAFARRVSRTVPRACACWPTRQGARTPRTC